MVQRAQRLSAQLPNGAQAALIHNPSNMRYLSGYTGEGLLVIGQGTLAIVTDFRYTEQAQQEAPGFTVHQTAPQRGHNVLALELLEALGAKQVAIEEGAITYAQYKALVKSMPEVTFVSLESLPETLRRIKDEAEMDALARANALTSQAFEHILGVIEPGMTEKAIALALESYLVKNGADSTAFATIVASGPNGSLCHATPGPRQVQKGDLITLDFGAKVGGYCADMTRTVALGDISPELRRIYEVVQEAQQRALAAVRAGVPCREVDAVARTYIDQQGFEGKFGHGLGHATGLDIHEAPACNASSPDTLEEGMTMTIEPGIYVPGLGGVRIEDSVIVTKDGCRILTPATKALVTIR